MKQVSGFTLLEVLVVVAIMGILLTMSVGPLKSLYASSAEKEAARNVLGALRLARSNAISQNLEYQVAFDLDSQTFWLERGNIPEGSTSWSRVREFDRFLPSLKMATGALCTNDAASDGDGTSAADNMIQFNPSGTCGSSGTANARYICVMNNGVVQYRSGVPSSSTGRAVIDNGE